MSDQLSKKYLLYLRDMSRKVVYGSSAAGNYAQVLIKGSKVNKNKRLQRVTNMNIKDISNQYDWFNKSINQEKLGNGIFCASGILTGSFSKQSGASKILKLISGPILYSQILFEEDNDFEISDWLINYDLMSILFGTKSDDDDDIFTEIETKDDMDGKLIIELLENNLINNNLKDISEINKISMNFINNLRDLQNNNLEIRELPRLCCEEAINLKEVKKEKGIFCAPGDWLFFAPVPPGLSTYRALNDLAEEIS